MSGASRMNRAGSGAKNAALGDPTRHSTIATRQSVKELRPRTGAFSHEAIGDLPSQRPTFRSCVDSFGANS